MGRGSLDEESQEAIHIGKIKEGNSVADSGGKTRQEREVR